MRVFVTGVAGFLGSHVAERFRDLGHEVRGIDNLQGGDPENVPPGVEMRVVDCLDRETYLPFMQGSDLVYHCAAAAYDGLSVYAPAYVFRHTAQATTEVASAAISAGVGRFVHCSSMARYGDVAPPFTEDQTPRPANVYGHAKLVSEAVVTNLFSTHGGEWSIAVPHNIFGPRQRFVDPYRNVVAISINRMLKGLQPVIYGDGLQERCFSHIADVLYCMEQMGLSPAASGQVVNIGPDEGTVTILQLMQEIADLLDFDLEPIFVPRRATEVRVATCSAEKARRMLGYRTKTGLLDGLRSTIAWISANGPRDFRYDREIEIISASTPRTWIDRLI